MFAALDLITLIRALVNCAHYISLHEIWFGSNMEIKSALHMLIAGQVSGSRFFFLAKTTFVIVVTHNNFTLQSTSFRKLIR